MPDCSVNCPHTSRITKLETQYDLLVPTIGKIDGKLDIVVGGLNRVELLETKHSTHTEAIERAFKRIEVVEAQSVTTAKALADMLSQLKGMYRLGVVMWVVLGGTIGFILNKVI